MASVICPAQIDMSDGQSPALLLSTDKFPLSLYNVEKKKNSVPKALFISRYMNISAYVPNVATWP